MTGPFEKDSVKMEIVNNTPFLFAYLPGRVGFPGHSLTLLVKATFDLTDEGRCEVAAEQRYPTGDELYPDDDEGGGSLRYASDFAFFKPRADLSLVGKCHAPEGREVPVCTVSFGVGGYTRSALVYGHRFWQGLTFSTSAPEPFAKMDLRYENCYGGPGFAPNPVGRGYGATKGHRRPLPNVEDPDQTVDLPGYRPKPAGFGPIHPEWRSRAAKMGSYGGGWVKERWPWFAEDFDWSYFNAAPEPLQVEGYLQGDEIISLENLHPFRSRYQAPLPALRMRMFTRVVDLRNPSPVFGEVPLKLDTLWVDTDAVQLVLVWRGVIAVSGEDYPEVEHLFITSEPLDQPPASLEAMQHLFVEVLAENEKEFELTPLEPPEEVETEPVDLQAVEQALQESREQMRKIMQAAGLDPPAEEGEAAAPLSPEEAGILERLGVDLPVDPPPLTREGVVAGIASGKNFAGEDLRGLDLSGLDLRQAGFPSAILAGTNLSRSKLIDVDLGGADLSGADLTRADLRSAMLRDADLTGACLRHADLAGADLADAIFDEAVLTEACLRGCKAEGTSFSAAQADRSDFSEACCHSADFGGSRLKCAVFRNADLSQASLENAVGLGIDLAGAKLTGLRASGSTDLSMGRFRGVAAAGSIWEEAVINGADFRFADLEGANFASACLVEADFSCANLKFARLSKSALGQARCVSVNLFQAALEKTDLTETDLRAANIYGAELLDAILLGTRLDGADLSMTKLSGRAGG